MTPSIPLHPDDLDTVTEHALAIGTVAKDPHLQDLTYGFEDLPDEIQQDWRRWARAACAGAPARACNMGMATWTAARGMARVLAERRREANREDIVELEWLLRDIQKLAFKLIKLRQETR